MGQEPASQNKSVDIHSVSELCQDYTIFQTRNAKAYVATMVDIVAAINACPMGKLRNIDPEELQSQTGHLLYYELKSVDNPIACDIEYVPQLYSHFRKPTLLVLKRIKRYLMGNHRRVLGRLEREQAMEKVVNMTAFDVSQKIRMCMEEIGRYQRMSEMVRGGGRKLDILMQALHVPSRVRFELLFVDRILRDPHHQRHGEAMAWLKKSKFKGNAKALHSLINNGFQMLDNATNKILDAMEDLSGLQFPRDNSAIDVHRSWYSLGATLPRGEDFVKSFTSEEKIEHQIKRVTYPMIRISYDAERLRAQKDRFLVEINLPKVQATQLSNLFFDLEHKIKDSTTPDGEVAVAIETDFKNGMLSIRERDEAETWVRENKIKLQELIMEIYETLHKLKEENDRIALPERLEKVIEAIKSGHAGDRDEALKSTESELGKLSIDGIVKRVNNIETKLDNPNAELLSELEQARTEIIEFIDRISINNIEFHKKVRDAYTDFSDYENKVLQLYGMEEQLENMRVKVEGYLLDVYRLISYVGVPEKTLDVCISVVIETMLLNLKKLEYRSIDGDVFESYFNEALKMDEEDCILHLDQLLQEIEAVPRTEHLLQALHDWEKDLKKDEYKQKEEFLLANGERIQAITDKARAELRERLSSGKIQPKRLRFEVFGLSDCNADSLRSLLESMMSMAPRLANDQEGEQLMKGLNTLEAQVIEAQRITKPGGEAFKKLKQMEQNESISPELIRDLHRDLELNFSDLDQLLEGISAAQKRVKVLQNKFGAKKSTDHLEVTLNINDLDRLKQVYEFIDTVTMEDIKRFCVAYNLKTGLMNSLFEKARKKDISVSKEITQYLNNKAYKLFQDKRFISLPLRTAILKNSKEIFEAECQLLCHTLNLVKSLSIRQKASYMTVLALLEQAKNSDHQLVKMLGLIWGRMQTRLFKFKPQNHPKNFEGNRQALLTDINELCGDVFKK
ncbi:hypothetical protein SCOR_04680 [Sulfidibacter corallicola]|uniref:Uncharacterized protein n=1 Tax=Sulfidibacter corallicola TaxID=2818388 RepID=A0A8A4TSC5_SULCO|nr:hypothetical protein [Sulfidibacter corallicola]QTD51931.1 hypothetical protein J3U87_05615 [Sulfidibacter corallicola]